MASNPVTTTIAVKKIPPSFTDDAIAMVKVTIGSGEDKKSYFVHKKFATFYSPFLDKACNGPFREGKSLIVTLDDFEFPHIFGLVLNWMYSQKIKYNLDQKISDDDLYRLWILADRLLIPKLKNVAIQEICLHPASEKSFSLTNAGWIYENTASDSPLRRILADRCAYDLGVKEWKDIKEKLPLDLLVDIALAYRHDALSCRRGWNCVDGTGKRCGRTLRVTDYHVKEDDA